MDYLTLRQAKDLIPQVESPVFMKWIENNKLHTKGESINLLIEKEYFYKSFSLPIEPPKFIEKPIILEGQTIKQTVPVVHILEGKEPPKIAISSAIDVKLPDGKTVGVNGKVAFSNTEGISEVDNLEFLDEQVAGINEAKVLGEFEQRKLEADKYCEDRHKQGDLYYTKIVEEADQYSKNKKAEADKYYDDVLVDINAKFTQQNKWIEETTAKADAYKKGVEDKVKEILPIYKGLQDDMLYYQTVIQRVVTNFKVHINEDGWYSKAIRYFENLNKKIEGVVK